MPNRPNFPIPDDIHAEPFCLCIQVPNDPTWKRVVAGLLDELNQWYNWQRDEDRSGRECAQVWRDLYAQIDWTTMSCCCDSTNPPQYRYTSVGILQVSIDGGVTYTDAPNADVRNNSPQFPPIEGDDSDDKKCSAATGAANLVKEQVGDQLTDDMGRYTLNQLINDWTHTMIDTSNPFLALVNVVANQIFALVISALRAALTDDVYHLFACALYCTMADDASFDDAQWAAARARITTDISGIAGVFLEHLAYLLGKVGLTNLVRSAPDATGDCSDCGCGDCLSHDRVHVYLGTDFAWTGDCSFDITAEATGGEYVWLVYVDSDCDDTTVTYWQVTSEGLGTLYQNDACGTGHRIANLTLPSAQIEDHVGSPNVFHVSLSNTPFP